MDSYKNLIDAWLWGDDLALENILKNISENDLNKDLIEIVFKPLKLNSTGLQKIKLLLSKKDQDPLLYRFLLIKGLHFSSYLYDEKEYHWISKIYESQEENDLDPNIKGYGLYMSKVGSLMLAGDFNAIYDLSEKIIEKYLTVGSRVWFFIKSRKVYNDLLSSKTKGVLKELDLLNKYPHFSNLGFPNISFLYGKYNSVIGNISKAMEYLEEVKKNSSQKDTIIQEKMEVIILEAEIELSRDNPERCKELAKYVLSNIGKDVIQGDSLLWCQNLLVQAELFLRNPKEARLLLEKLDPSIENLFFIVEWARLFCQEGNLKKAVSLIKKSMDDYGNPFLKFRWAGELKASELVRLQILANEYDDEKEFSEGGNLEEFKREGDITSSFKNNNFQEESQKTKKYSDFRREKICQLFKNRKRLSRAEIIYEISCAPDTASRDLKFLVNEEFIRRVETSASPRTSYFELIE